MKFGPQKWILDSNLPSLRPHNFMCTCAEMPHTKVSSKHNKYVVLKSAMQEA
jgi:hypothetical protein